MKRILSLAALAATAAFFVPAASPSNLDPGGGAGAERYCTFHNQIINWNGSLWQCYYVPYYGFTVYPYP